MHVFTVIEIGKIACWLAPGPHCTNCTRLTNRVTVLAQYIGVITGVCCHGAHQYTLREGDSTVGWVDQV